MLRRIRSSRGALQERPAQVPDDGKRLHQQAIWQFTDIGADQVLMTPTASAHWRPAAGRGSRAALDRLTGGPRWPRSQCARYPVLDVPGVHVVAGSISRTHFVAGVCVERSICRRDRRNPSTPHLCEGPCITAALERLHSAFLVVWLGKGTRGRGSVRAWAGWVCTVHCRCHCCCQIRWSGDQRIRPRQRHLR